MRIGFDAKRATLNFTGLGNYSRALIENLGHYFPSHAYVLFTPGLINSRRYPRLLINPPFTLRLPQKWFERLPGFPWRFFYLNTLLETERIDLYHGLSGELPWGAKKKSCGYVLTVHDLIFFRYPLLYKPLDRLLYSLKLRYASKKADHIVAISHQTRQDLIDFLSVSPERISVIYQACDPIYYTRPSAEALEEVKARLGLPSRYLLFVGSLEERKNLVTLIKAFTVLVKERAEGLRLVLVGKRTKYFTELNSGPVSAESRQDITVYHDMTTDDLPAVYQLASCLVYPSLFEGFGLPILEAITSGTPVITSSGSCFSEAGGPSTVYVNPLDAGLMSQKIQEVLSSEAIQQKMKVDGLTHAKEFTAEKLSSQLMNLYYTLRPTP